MWYLALDVTANSICEIHCLALDGFILNAVHKLSGKEKKSRRILGGKQKSFPPPPFKLCKTEVVEKD